MSYICHVSCTSQLSQKSELMERLMQFTYTVTPPLTCDSRRKGPYVQPEESDGAQVSEVCASTNSGLKGMTQEVYTWTQRYGSRDVYTWTQKGGYEHFLKKNCGNQDSNSRPLNYPKSPN